jgi:nucleoside-diphosphate-sugar epimerase
MNNLVIGNTSQLSFYFPEDYIKISSRNLDINDLKSKNWNRVYICIGESRKFIQNIKLYDDINFYLTLDIIDALKDSSRNIIIYSTCELWNQYDGQISIDNNFNFYSTPYLQSKFKISKFILDNKKDYSNVIVLYPFNFNSIHRNTNFLFGKIFNSIVEKKVIEIGDTYFYRDIIHPNFVVKESICATSHKIIGSGRMVYVNDFIRDLYERFNMKYDEYIIENKSKFNEYEKRKEYYLGSKENLYSYNSLINDTIKDIKNYENSRIRLGDK